MRVRDVPNEKRKYNNNSTYTIDISVTQMIVGKQWVVKS